MPSDPSLPDKRLAFPPGVCDTYRIIPKIPIQSFPPLNEQFPMDIKTFGFYFLLFIIIAVGAKFYLIISSFFPAITTAFVLAFLTTPIYRYFLKSSKRKTFSAFSVLFLVLVLILFPSILVFFAIQRQVAALLSQETIEAVYTAFLNARAMVSDRLGLDILAHINFEDLYSQMAVTAQNAVTVFAPRVIISITGFLLSAFLVFFLLFYLLVNSAHVISTFRAYFPLSNRNIDLLLAEVASGTRSLILGQFLIALVQGSLGAIGFLIFGVPGVLLWGVVMTLLSFIPFLGSFIVWVPAGLILLAQGKYFAGFGLMIWGFSLVSTVDNLIRPKLTSSLGRIHPVTVLIGVFIGLKEWGVIGLVLGPLIITVLLALIRMFREEYLTERPAPVGAASPGLPPTAADPVSSHTGEDCGIPGND